MSRIDDLIVEFCPNGVEHKELGMVCEFKRGTSITQKDVIIGNIPVIAGGQKPAYYCNRSNRSGETIAISSSGAYAGFVSYWAKPLFVSDAFTVDPKEMVNTKYLYYFLKNNQQRIYSLKKGGGVPHVHGSDIATMKIPIPHLEIQCEIVRILDNFTELTAELTAELIARKKQYEYYRDKLLTFGDNVPKATLSHCCISITDGDHQAPPKVENGIPFITISNISESKQIDFSNTKFVTEAYYNKLDDKRKARTNDILYTVVGSFGIPVYIDRDMKFTFQRHIAILRPDSKIIISKYLYHVLQSSDFLKQADTVAVGAAQKTITLSALNQMKLPMPSLAEQARIVSILDRFETLANDIRRGLPAEIEARRKQYEYYRDKLLTFKEKKS